MTEEKLMELCAWIESQIGQTLGWQELMHQSGVDHLSIQAAFTKYKGTTPMTWIRKRRVELADSGKKKQITEPEPSYLAR